MADRDAKTALLEEFAAVGKALGSPARLELLDLLTQGPRTVEDLARTAGLGLSTCSAHLQRLHGAGLVTTRRDGTRIWYSLAGDDVAGLLAGLRRVARRRRPGTESARRRYVGEDVGVVEVAALLRADRDAGVVVLDVRPAAEFAAGHLPGAVHIPLEELVERLGELPTDREVVAYCRGDYCALAHEAVRVLTAHGRRARRVSDGILEWRAAGVPLVPSS
ncbi:ArsR/SmtB family transcription factor [Georgenia muralis]|uniref:ArsR family transcriptional regulator n=1 Tax=Georgenia muralis TaxID=154117 RepID=A0A3N4Z2J3_9MICO|nr:metalloregulator ArsR/SmtB family transcription factor [Georgenia muralis]RPF26733.1 ArsR family transcriptional regulator [Georgenia muralis]